MPLKRASNTHAETLLLYLHPSIPPSLSIRHAELAARVLHEICRYRSGCVALAKDPVAIKAITEFPLISIHMMEKILFHGTKARPGMRMARDVCCYMLHPVDFWCYMLHPVKTSISLDHLSDESYTHTGKMGKKGGMKGKRQGNKKTADKDKHEKKGTDDLHKDEPMVSPHQGMLDQVLVDTIGRCLNGLADHPELARGIVTSLQGGAGKSFLAGIADGEKFLTSLVAELGTKPTQGSWTEVNMGPGMDMRYLDLEGALKRLNVAMSSIASGTEGKPWKSCYCMDRIVMRDFDPAPQADLCKASICHVCLKRGKLGTDVFYCSRCKNVTYCSKACQKNHWQEHKAECVKQKRSSQAPVTDPATLAQMFKQLSATRPNAKADEL